MMSSCELNGDDAQLLPGVRGGVSSESYEDWRSDLRSLVDFSVCWRRGDSNPRSRLTPFKAGLRGDLEVEAGGRLLGTSSGAMSSWVDRGAVKLTLNVGLKMSFPAALNSEWRKDGLTDAENMLASGRDRLVLAIAAGGCRGPSDNL